MGVCIETDVNSSLFSCPLMSHPIWVCVLKLITSAPLFRKAKSHPIWVCVLKLLLRAVVNSLALVTPYMGVCIET